MAVTSLAVLAACSTVSPTPPASSNGYLLTVKISESDTQQAVVQKFGGEAISWHPDAGFAILKMSNEATAQLSTRGISMQGTTLSTNASTVAPEVTAAGWTAWGGGWNTWAGGWNTWAGGWNTWAGGLGNIPAMPWENRYPFKQSSFSEAQVLAKKFGDGSKVAVIDTGIDTAHPMFTGRLAPSTEWKDFVDGDSNPQDVSGGAAYGHGTVVAGIIAQYAPKATILPIRVLKSDGSGDVNNVISAIDWAIQKGANIINLSLGTTTDVAAFKTEVAYATSLGIYVVASAGNSAASILTYPAEYATTITNPQFLISVASADSSSSLSTFSNRDAALEAVAAGESIYSAYPGNQIAYATGTSFAAPQISGVLALARSNTASSNWSSLGTILANSGSWNSAKLGSGRFVNTVDFLKALPDYVGTRKALFVVGNTTLTAGDNAVNTRLWILGYTVTVKSGAATTSADATGKDLVVISASVNPTDVNTKFKSVAVPVVIGDAQLFDDMGLVQATTGYFGTATAQMDMTVVNNSLSHPLSGYLFPLNANNTGQIFASSASMSWGKPPSTAISVATLATDGTKKVVFAYDKGATMVGMTAPARRVAMLFDDTSSANVGSYWASTWLFDSIITWASIGS